MYTICSVSYGQIGGKYAYEFLNLGTSPRQAALGEKVITIYDEDVNQALFNPATINKKNNSLAVYSRELIKIELGVFKSYSNRNILL